MMLSPILLHCLIESSDHYSMLGKLLILLATEEGTSLLARGSCFWEVMIVRSSTPLCVSLLPIGL